MIFDELGLPKMLGADDYNDSAMLAGMMTLFEWPEKIDLMKYVVSSDDFAHVYYVRHPLERKFDFSRDQTVPLMSGLWKQKGFGAVDKELITGKDFLSPSVRGHIKRCQGKKANWFEDAWLWADIWWSTKVKPNEEQNQIICLCMVAGPKYVKAWCKWHPDWKSSIHMYWSGWRGEIKFADHICKKILEIINK